MVMIVGRLQSQPAARVVGLLSGPGRIPVLSELLRFIQLEEISELEIVDLPQATAAEFGIVE